MQKSLSRLLIVVSILLCAPAESAFIADVQQIVLCDSSGNCADSSFDQDRANTIFSQADLSFNFIDPIEVTSADYFSIETGAEANSLLIGTGPNDRPGATAPLLSNDPIPLWFVGSSLVGPGRASNRGLWVHTDFPEFNDDLIARWLAFNLGVPINNPENANGDTTGCIQDNLMNTPVFSPDLAGLDPVCALGSTLTADQISIIQSSDIVREIAPVPIPAAAWLFASALGVFGYLVFSHSLGRQRP